MNNQHPILCWWATCYSRRCTTFGSWRRRSCAPFRETLSPSQQLFTGSVFEIDSRSWFSSLCSKWISNPYLSGHQHLEPYGAKASRLGVAFQNPVKLESALDFPFIEDDLIIWEGIYGNLFIWNFQHENGLQLWPNWDIFSFFSFSVPFCVLSFWKSDFSAHFKRDWCSGVLFSRLKGESELPSWLHLWFT